MNIKPLLTQCLIYSSLFHFALAGSFSGYTIVKSPARIMAGNSKSSRAYYVQPLYDSKGKLTKDRNETNGEEEPIKIPRQSPSVSELLKSEQKEIRPKKQEQEKQGLEKTLEKTSQELEKIDQELDKLSRRIDKIEQRLDIFGEFKVFSLLTNPKIDFIDLFKHAYPPGKRNEISYSEYFQNYLESYLFTHNYLGHISKQLDRNNQRDLLELSFRFQTDGSYRLEKIVPAKGVNDFDGKIRQHYRKLFSRLKSKFVPLSEAGLSAPYYADYILLNRWFILKEMDRKDAEYEKEKSKTIQK